MQLVDLSRFAEGDHGERISKVFKELFKERDDIFLLVFGSEVIGFLVDPATFSKKLKKLIKKEK